MGLVVCGMWDPPGQGMEPMSPALVGGFFAPEPPGKLSSKWYVNTDFSKARACVLLLSGAASDGRSLGAAGSMTSE